MRLSRSWRQLAIFSEHGTGFLRLARAAIHVRVWTCKSLEVSATWCDDVEWASAAVTSIISGRVSTYSSASHDHRSTRSHAPAYTVTGDSTRRAQTHTPSEMDLSTPSEIRTTHLGSLFLILSSDCSKGSVVDKGTRESTAT